MKKGMRFTFRNEIMLSYLVVILSMVVVGIVGMFHVGKVYNNGNDIYENDMKAVVVLKSVSENLKELDKCTSHVLIDAEWEHDENCENQIEQLITDNITLLDEYGMLKMSQKETELYNRGKDNVLAYHKQIEELLHMKHTATEAQVLKTYQENLLPVKAETSEMITIAVDLAVVKAEQRNKDNYSIFIRSIVVICVCMLLAGATAFGIALKVCNLILTKLKAVQMMAKRMSEYDISNDIEFNENDIFGQTAEALKESQFMVRELVEKVIHEASSISDMGEEISLAIRKSEQKIENVNVKILEYEKLAQEVEIATKKIVDEADLEEEEMHVLVHMRDTLSEAKDIRAQARTELSNIATYLEQIGITSDSQNEITSEHKLRVSKFKIKEREEE